MSKKHFADDFIDAINSDNTLNEASKNIVLRNLAKIKETKVNILITGATGCGKSSTINALFNANKAKVGQGVDPETMEISKYEFDNIVLFDSPGLGDGKEADLKHAKAITNKLYEKDKDGNLLIDLVLVILDGSSRDLGTSFELINQVIIPNLGDDKNRLLVAINQADMAMKGRYWNVEKNHPEPELVNFLEEKVISTKNRIYEATGVKVDPIYYAAGYKDGVSTQNPYNLSKLLVHILRHTKEEKRAVFAQDINSDKEMWKDDDRLEDYRTEIKETLLESIKNSASAGADIGESIGAALGMRTVGKVIGGVAGGIWGGVKSIFGF
ncbi:GTPase family protein [Comamonas sp. C11]|uniref:GTPase family protein n=1 Tax=Comamonas sp. C11 TaxID=2966554 RepID=UPI0021114B94|nr:GTPase [Comamonas sp. C11]UUC96748.1 50S ribosome-binding GTPase [Comamonas sp. C11]